MTTTSTDSTTTTLAPIEAKAGKVVKPGYRTTEGWLTAIALAISMLYALDLVAPEGTSSIAKALALIAGVLATMGYSVSRGLAKK